MKREEYERLRTLGLKWINESQGHLMQYRLTRRPMRAERLNGMIDAKTSCTQDLLKLLEKMEVEV